jgi:hypothetical protein
MPIPITFNHLMLSLSKHELTGRGFAHKQAQGVDLLGGLKNAE